MNKLMKIIYAITFSLFILFQACAQNQNGFTVNTHTYVYANGGWHWIDNANTPHTLTRNDLRSYLNTQPRNALKNLDQILKTQNQHTPYATIANHIIFSGHVVGIQSGGKNHTCHGFIIENLPFSAAKNNRKAGDATKNFLGKIFLQYELSHTQGTYYYGFQDDASNERIYGKFDLQLGGISKLVGIAQRAGYLTPSSYIHLVVGVDRHGNVYIATIYPI